MIYRRVIEGPNLVIQQPQEFIDNMDEWNTNQHGRSGLNGKFEGN